MSDAFKYVTHEDGLLRRLGIGSVLVLTSFLLIPAFFLSGYYLRVARAAKNGDEEPPRFQDWGELGILGLKMLAVGLIYGILAFLFMAVMLVMVRVGGVVAILGGVLGLAGLAAVMYVAPAGIVLLADRGRIGDALDFDRIRRIAGTRSYFVGFLLAILINFVGNFIGQILVAFFLIGLPIIFASQVAMWYVLGDAVRKSEETLEETTVTA